MFGAYSQCLLYAQSFAASFLPLITLLGLLAAAMVVYFVERHKWNVQHPGPRSRKAV
jgi:Na+/H+ antiporter NhaD/arsenite permease-like protein